MRPTGARTALGAGMLLGVAVFALVIGRGAPAEAELPPAYDEAPLPPGLDSATTLFEASAQADTCRGACATVVYVWTPRMPLSRAGIAHVARAVARLGVDLTLVAHEDLADYASGTPAPEGGVTMPLADAMLAAGVLAHAPALVVVRDGEPRGAAILGYKTAAAYESAIARRLARADSEREAAVAPAAVTAQAPMVATEASGRRVAAAPDPPSARAGARLLDQATSTPRLADYQVVGVPGAYFRWVPGRDAVAYEASQRVYLLDLADGRSRAAPGFIDFVPTPDGRYFVTPGEVEGGLAFYDADEVFEAVRRGRPADAEPIFTDLTMRDQYPSVGILAQDSARTLYRVMTSWFEGVVYRDYDVRVDARSGAASVRPVAEPVRPCAGVGLSTPIISQDGLEVAGRDEATGTTKIFGILQGGRCEAVADLSVPTSKVAWHPTGRKLAFSIPRQRRGGDESEQGIFVLDRDARDLTRLPGSEGASRLAFPDFVGDDSVIFLIPGSGAQPSSVFRLVAHGR